MKRLVLLLACALLPVSFAFAQGAPRADIETSQTFGPYTVHYSLFPSTFLSAEVATAYEIVRAADRAVLNISVRRDTGDGNDRAQTAVVTGKYSDLIQSKSLTFREIREEGAIYYIAQFRHSDRETLRFDISVQPDPNAPARTITFTREMHVQK
ncbi:MAG: DUF4426 domain-containing protein [Spongiibacteraceae bacterium]|nr:DUF4426 domain-containing protein [Spongiibacteraceae bacterium]